MRNTFDIVDIIYSVLSNDSSVTGEISGSVYKYKRPANSQLEDVVIGSLPVNNDQVQRTVSNVNIHVPNLKINTNGNQDNTQPDAKRLKAITSVVIGSLDDKYFDDYWFDVQQQNIFEDESTSEHYSNIRLNFYSDNI